MVVGKYLIIKEILIDDYAVVGGVSTIAPGTIFGRETVLGALSSTNFKQILEDGWIYFGIPGIQLKKNRFIEERRDVIVKRDVDEETKKIVTQEVNIDEDKKHLVHIGGEN
jgi:carbonic anhydrase/acetyltransferase-like protein (isoleucine patch superfamily)